MNREGSGGEWSRERGRESRREMNEDMCTSFGFQSPYQLTGITV